MSGKNRTPNTVTKKGGGKAEYDTEFSTNFCEMKMEQYKHRQHVSYYLIFTDNMSAII